jgi:hypothetical protein
LKGINNVPWVRGMSVPRLYGSEKLPQELRFLLSHESQHDLGKFLGAFFLR